MMQLQTQSRCMKTGMDEGQSRRVRHVPLGRS